MNAKDRIRIRKISVEKSTVLEHNLLGLYWLGFKQVCIASNLVEVASLKTVGF